MIHILILLFKWLSDSSRDRKPGFSLRQSKRRVRVLDPETNKVTSIRVWELPAGMVPVDLRDTGPAWVQAGAPNPDGALHPPFPPAAQDVVKGIKETLDEVHPRTQVEWEKEFRRCVRPEVEVARWLQISDAYTLCTREKGLAPEARQDYFNVICAGSVLRREEVLPLVKLSAISRADAEEALGLYLNRQSRE